MKKFVVIGNEEEIVKAKEALASLDVEINDSLQQEWLMGEINTSALNNDIVLSREQQRYWADRFNEEGDGWDEFFGHMEDFLVIRHNKDADSIGRNVSNTKTISVQCQDKSSLEFKNKNFKINL